MLAISSYLQHRAAKGEEITDSSPLIREQYDQQNINKARRISLYTLRLPLTKVIKDSGIVAVVKTTDNKARHEVPILHGIRMWWNGHMVQANCNLTLKKQLIGHKPLLEGSYLKPSDDQLLFEAMKAWPFLTLSYRQLKTENDKLKSQVADIEVLRRGFYDFRNEPENQRRQTEEHHLQILKLLYKQGILKKMPPS